jgi:hypothetical protein
MTMTAEPKYLAKARAYLRKQYVRSTPILAEAARASRILASAIEVEQQRRGGFVPEDLHAVLADLTACIERSALGAHPEPEKSNGFVQTTLAD